jgi:dihydropteroate synthase
MGVVNVTPDSFSDGGRFLDPAAGYAHGLQLLADGADILDVGGESTRPGADPVPEGEELRRVLPVVAGLVRRGAVVSVDTSKPAVAEACLDAGAHVINDVTGLTDPAMVAACRRAGCGVVVMHMRGTPRTMQQNPDYADVSAEVTDFLADRLTALAAAGIPPERVAVDPGVGFGKTLPHTLEQLARLRELQRLGRPVLLGVSRKGFLGQVTGRERPDRLAGTLAVNCFAVAAGAAHVLRVHDVAAHRDAALLHEAIARHAR